jgi:hypothetical protein
MSNPFAIAGVTAVLMDMLHNSYSGWGPTIPSVSAIAPDLVKDGSASGSDASLQLNLFMHQVTYNAAWRNVGQPSVAPDGSTRLSNPPLALDLHYLLTAYASHDCEAEALLGFAIQLLHQTPVIPRGQIANGLNKLPSANPISGHLAASGLADQIEMIKITPATLGREELAWLWTALKADYRPTFPFQVSVVLIEPQFPAYAGLPVLKRKIVIQPGSTPQLLGVVPLTDQAAASAGEVVTVVGQSLSGANMVALTNQRLGIQYPPFAPLTVTDSTVTFRVPTDPAGLPAGLYGLSMLFTASGQIVQSTNPVSISIAPTIASVPAPTVVPNATGLLVTISCAPDVMPNQSVSLALGATIVPAVIFDSKTSLVQFQFPTLASGQYLALLRVDGVDSPVNWTASPPGFTGPLVTV